MSQKKFFLNLKNKKNIIIIHTFFHAKQVKNIPVIKRNQHTIVFVSPKLNKDAVNKELSEMDVRLIPEYSFSKSLFKKNPLKFIFYVRKEIKRLKFFIEKNILKELKIDECNLFIFNEKDIFCQILVRICRKYKLSVSLASVDEGIAHYRRKIFVDNIIDLFYKIFGVLFLRFPLKFVAGFGRTFPITYLRFPELLEDRKGYGRIIKMKIHPISNMVFENSFMSNSSVLILTSPLSEDNYLGKGKEIKILNCIIRVLKKYGFKISIKPHPRENIAKFQLLNYDTLIGGNVLFEDIEIKNFKYILNFGSSIVLNLYERGFPLSNVITYKIFKIEHYPLFDHTVIIKDCNQLNLFLGRTNKLND